MALRTAMVRSSGVQLRSLFGFRSWTHSLAQPAPFDTAINHTTTSPPLFLLEFDRSSENNNKGNSIGIGFPSFSFGSGSMDLMAVPKKKVSPHKRGIRNGPKALKPVPVIIRCKVCGRVKLPHFYCCSGIKENTSEREGSTS
ncbi:unnamed protein product [Ilex paraguariensis]|uniref:Large ribosomal subunit protein bL32m n=1 Tax=Ilex paraguariensis TaxID=185542 RepID=A0ABC8R0J1_9AQUA